MQIASNNGAMSVEVGVEGSDVRKYGSEGFSRGHRLWHLGNPFQWALFDGLIAFGCMLVGFYASPSADGILQNNAHIRPFLSAIIFAFIAFLASYALGIGSSNNQRSRFRIEVLLLILTVLASTGTLLVTSILLYKQIGRLIVFIAAGFFFLSESVVRLLWYQQIKNVRHKVAIWSDLENSNMLRELMRNSSFPMDVVFSEPPGVASEARLKEIIAGNRAHEVVVHGVDDAHCATLLAAFDQGTTVSSLEAFAERHFQRVPVSLVGPKWFFDIDLKQHHPFYETSKRVLDVILAITGSVVAVPIIVVAVVLIRAESPGPVFYSQMRLGLKQRGFRIWKLRTMRVNAEASGAQWASPSDSRVTRIGRLLRRSRIDELPQLWNIICGEMSVVGPRPERPEFVERLEKAVPYYRQRHSIKPGLTGWAQINFPYGASEEDAREKISYDFYYLKNASFLLDFQIVLQTIGAVAKGSR